HIGAAEKMRSVENRLRVDDLDWTMLDRWEAAALRALPGGEFVSYGPRVPAEVLESQIAVSGRPPGRCAARRIGACAHSHRDEHNERMVPRSRSRRGRPSFDRSARSRRRPSSVSPTWDSRTPDRIYQLLTGVQRDKRGLGLAKGLKTTMLRTIRMQFPTVLQVVTYNAQSNAAMLAINNRLGFTVHRHYGTYQIDRQAIGALGRPPG